MKNTFYSLVLQLFIVAIFTLPGYAQGPSIDCPDNIVTIADPGQCGALVDYEYETSSGSSGDLPAFYPLEDDLVDDFGNAPNAFVTGSVNPPSPGNPVCVPAGASWIGDRFSTFGFGSIDANAFKFSVEFNLDSYGTNSFSGSPILMMSTGFRWIGIFTLPDGRIGTSYLNSNYPPSTTTVNLDQWYKAEVVYDNGTAYLYLDDVLIQEVVTGPLEYPGFSLANLPTTSNLLTGNGSTGGAFNGCLRNVAVSNLNDDGTGGAPPTVTDNAPDVFPVGTTLVTATATNASGSSNCSFLVTVIDNQAPTITCPSSITVNTDPGTCGAVISSGNNNLVWSESFTGGQSPGTAICQSWSNYINGLTPNSYTSVTIKGTFDPVGIPINDPAAATQLAQLLNTRTNGAVTSGGYTWRVGNGCVASPPDCESAPEDVVLSVSTNSFSNFTCQCPNNSVYLLRPHINNSNWGGVNTPTCGAPSQTMTLEFTVAGGGGGGVLITTSDNCSGETLNQISGLPLGSSFPVGVTTNTYVVSDAAGNSASCSFDITVVDNEAPTAICLSTTVEIQPDGTYTLQQADVFDAANSSDNCAIASVNFPAATYTCADVGLSFPVLVNITDPSNNTDDCTATVSVVEGNALPDGWSGNDIGQVTIGNAYSFAPCTPTGGEFSVTGSGNNAVSTTTDNVAFANQTLCGDGMITAKIESIDPNGYGGLMIRETTAAGSKQVAIFSNLTNVLRHEARAMTNGPKQVQAFYRPNPFWLRLQRQGDWIFTYYSTTGGSFQYIHGEYVPMQSCVEIGLASFTNFPNQQTEAVFSNVSVSGNASLIGTGGLPTSEVASSEVGPTAEPELFPNPANSQFTLRFPQALQGEATATLRNQVGQVLQQRQLQPGDVTTEWNVSQLPAGLYFMEVRQEGLAPQVLRVVKQ